jgi:hypothetical protein
MYVNRGLQHDLHPRLAYLPRAQIAFVGVKLLRILEEEMHHHEHKHEWQKQQMHNAEQDEAILKPLFVLQAQMKHVHHRNACKRAKSNRHTHFEEQIADFELIIEHLLQYAQVETPLQTVCQEQSFVFAIACK